MTPAEARSYFPGVQGRVYLDAACISLMPVQAQAALQSLGTDLVACPARDASAHHIALDNTANQPRAEIACLIGARASQIALVESTTQALEILAAVIPLQRGERILVADTEFLGLAIPWIPRWRQQEIHIDVVPHRQGRILVDEFARLVDPHTRVILLSSVQWNSGYRADLAAFAELAEQQGILLVVDAIQHLGAFPLDVGQTPVDFLVCGGHKWLNAPAGRGFLYINPRVLPRLLPPPRGYLNVAQPEQGWAEYFATPTTPAVRDYDFVQGARAFEVGGTANYPGNVVLGAAVALLNEVGRDKIADHVLALTEHLLQGLDRLRMQVVSPREVTARSGIISFTLGDGPERDRQVLQALWERRVIISQRYTAGVGGLRVSSHVYNSHADIDQFLDALGELQR